MTRVASSVAFVLILLTVLGHACELPIGAVLAAHGHEHADEASHHHPEATDAACDAVPAIARPTDTPLPPVAVVQAAMHSLFGAVAPPVFASLGRDSHAVHRRVPLFLLHSILLI